VFRREWQPWLQQSPKVLRYLRTNHCGLRPCPFRCLQQYPHLSAHLNLSYQNLNGQHLQPRCRHPGFRHPIRPETRYPSRPRRTCAQRGKRPGFGLM
jgi:hypothetical protein